jgi:hypothetical protein
MRRITLGRLKEYQSIKVPSSYTSSVVTLMANLCNLIMGTPYYCSRIHFLLNYCLSSGSSMRDVINHNTDMILHRFNFMIFDCNGTAYSLVKESQTLNAATLSARIL